MMISPVEALDILEYLKQKVSFNKENLILKLESTINEFRLNTNTGIRKTYTCPFYTREKKKAAQSLSTLSLLGVLPSYQMRKK